MTEMLRGRDGGGSGGDGVVEAGVELGALLGEIPAAERGYDGKGFAGVTEKASRV